MDVEIEIFSAGGVVTRADNSGATEYLVVHRPYQDDWSMPKGKLEPGESFEDAARREVEEETGWRCELGRELPNVHYRDRKGRYKQVRYWLMTPVEFMGFEPNDEIDEVRWIPADEAAKLLTYDNDRQLIEYLRSERT